MANRKTSGVILSGAKHRKTRGAAPGAEWPPALGLKTPHPRIRGGVVLLPAGSALRPRKAGRAMTRFHVVID